MTEREQITKNIEDKLDGMFVEEYDKVNSAKDSINIYFKDLEINYVYDYNIFCVDFRNNAKQLINNLPPEDLININTTIFVFEVLSYMIRNKIDEDLDSFQGFLPAWNQPSPPPYDSDNEEIINNKLIT